jgi:hypothetical protein
MSSRVITVLIRIVGNALGRRSYENEVCAHWDTSGILKRIAAKKRFFREPRNGSETDAVLTEYSDCIRVEKQGMMCAGCTHMLEGRDN